MPSMGSMSLNALRASGYGGFNPYAARSYQLGATSAGYNVKKLNEQIELQKQQLQAMVDKWKGLAAINLIGQGWGLEGEGGGSIPARGTLGSPGGGSASSIVRDITGYDLEPPPWYLGGGGSAGGSRGGSPYDTERTYMPGHITLGIDPYEHRQRNIAQHRFANQNYRRLGWR